MIPVTVCSSRFFITGISFHTIRRIYESKMSNALMQQFVAGLKSRNAETRSKAARDLYHYVSTEYTVIFLLLTEMVHKANISKLSCFVVG